MLSIVLCHHVSRDIVLCCLHGVGWAGGILFSFFFFWGANYDITKKEREVQAIVIKFRILYQQTFTDNSS